MARGRQLTRRPDGAELHQRAQAWWHDWAHGAEAPAFHPWHWQRLEMTALLVDRYYATPSAAILAEIRANEKLLVQPERDPAGMIRLG